MPTREEILAELDRRKSASAPGGLSPEAIRAELARRAAMQAAAPSINRPSMGFDPVGEAARGMQKPMMDAMGSAVLGRPLPAPPAPPVDPLAPKGGWLPGQQQQQQARVADPGNPFNPRNAGRPDTGPPPPPDFGTLAEKAAKSVGGMIGGQRPESEAMAQFGGSVVTDPVGAANTAIEVLDPFHQAAYAYNDADAALKAGVTGDWKRAGNELKDLSQSGSFAAMSFLPGAEFAGAPGRMARAAGVAPKAAGAMASAAPEAVAAQVAPKPPQPMFTGPPGPAPSKGNFIVRRADQIVGGAVGATVGGTGDAIAAPGDGGGEEGGPPMGAISGAAIGIFGPRALANASSRGFRAAARPFRGGASFDERVAAKAVREALRSAGIRSADEAAAQMAARYGDKPAAVADLTQEGIGTAAGLSRLPGKTGEAAKARNADLLENRSGRLFTDIEGTTGIDPASVTKSIDDAIRQASEEISPAYEEMFAASRGVNSERLMQLMDDPVVAPYLRRAVQASESLATTAGQAPSNARTWDLVKRGLDRVIEGQIRTSGQAAPELMSARQAVRDELDGLIPEYKSIRDNADAPRMRAARKEGANAMGGRLSVEKVKKIASGLTGRPLTAMQAGMIEQLVPGIEKGQGITALASGRTEQALAAAFGEETARSLISRVRADAALTQNASRINPNVGSVTSQAGMGGGGVGGMIAGAVRAVRNPTEAGLSWLSKSGAYSKQQRDIMGEMLLEGTTPENLQRIFRGRGGPTAPRPQGPPRSAPRTPVKMGFGGGSSKGLRAAAIRYKGKVFSAETHDQALLDAEAAGVPIGKERIEEGFIGSNGKFVDRSDPNAALDALSAGQISDPTFRRMIEDKIRRGEAVSLVSDQVKLGSSKSLPMDEASRMGRRKEWQAEKGPVEDKTWFHSDSQGFDSVDPTKGELGLHVGDKFAADLISHRTKRARRWSSEDGRVAEPNMHEMFVRGNFASAPDLHNFASPLRYLEARMSPSKAAEFDSRYDKMWKQLDEQAREIYSRNGDDPAAWKSWRDAVHTSARDNKISGWEYANQYEAGVSRVIFDPTAARRTDATFDPSQSGSSKLLAGMPAGTSEAALGVGGGAYGAANPVDWDGDGTITDEEKHKTIMSYGMGSMFTPFLAKGGAGIARDVAKSVTIPKAANAAGRRFTEVGARKAWDRDLPGSSEFRSPAQSTFGGVKAKTADLPMDAASQRARGTAQGFDMDTPLYHGTASDFEAFDKAMRGKVFKDGDARQAFFFSTSPKVASGYADEAAYAGSIDKRNADPAYQKARQEWKDTLGKKNWMGQVDRDKQLAAQDNLTSVEKSIDMTEGAAVLPVYSRLRNPYVVDDIKEYDNTLFREAIDYAQANGHDGVIFKNVRDEVGKGGAGPSDIYAVFDPENIRGKFAKFDPAKTDSPIMMNGFGGPPKPQANALKGPPKKQGPALSRAAEEATRELKAARRAFNTASNKWVMKDDRELRVKPLEDRVVAAEAKLAQVLKNDARLKTLAARGRSVIESPNVNKPIAYGIGGAAIGASAIGAYNALKPQERGERPMSPTDPAFYWSTVTADKDKMVPVQLALKEWGEWPDDTEATGINGKVTKAAIKSWRYDRGLDPDAPMTKADTARLLAGPKGYQDRNGKTWRYGADGAPVSPP